MTASYTLLANLGNRNLLYQGQPLFAQMKQTEPALDFRSFTQHLWESYEAVRADLSLNILNVLLDARQAEISRVILFASDQPEGSRRDQDTLYVGHLLARMIPELYPGLQAEVCVLQAGVTDPNALLLAYRQALKALDRRFPEGKYLICDAGGTAQQKSSLKIMCEYLFDREDFEVNYVAQGKHYQSELQVVPPIEYRRILDAEQIRGLIARGEYRGAIDLYSHLNRKAADEPVFKLLQFGRYRSERLWMEAQRYANPADYPEELRPKLDFLADYRQLQAAGTHQAWAAELFSKRAYFEICECFAILQWEYQLEHYTETVLNIFRFMEAYLYQVLDEGLGYHFRQDFQTAQQALLQDIPRRFPEVQRRFRRMGKRRLRGGLPVLILAATHIPGLKHGEHEQMTDTFQSFNSLLNPAFRSEADILPLDTLRHQIAHRGLGVTKMEFQSIPRIDGVMLAWAKWLFMPEQNPYAQLNELIEELL